MPRGAGPWGPDARRAASASLRPAHCSTTPRILYLREADLLPHPDGWLSGLFDPAN
jgi:hypothetical protein